MFVNRMQSAANRMRQLINDLLSYSRVTTAAAPFSKVSLKDVLAGVLSDLQIRIEETGATVEIGEFADNRGGLRCKCASCSRT